MQLGGQLRGQLGEQLRGKQTNNLCLLQYSSMIYFLTFSRNTDRILKAEKWREVQKSITPILDKSCNFLTFHEILKDCRNNGWKQLGDNLGATRGQLGRQLGGQLGWKLGGQLGGNLREQLRGKQTTYDSFNIQVRSIFLHFPEMRTEF